MKKEIADAWVADLRTNPPQAKRCLFDGEGHCCLGRLALILGATFEQDADGHYHTVLEEDKEGDNSVLSPTLRDKAGMQSYNGSYAKMMANYINSWSLSDLNDRGDTFAEIADRIEKHWKDL